MTPAMMKPVDCTSLPSSVAPSRDGHAGMPKVAAARRRRVRQPLEREDEQDGRDQVGEACCWGRADIHLRQALTCFFFLNIDSIRWVTRKPPKTLMLASSTAKEADDLEAPAGLSSPVTSSAPTSTMPEMALVSATSGVCSDGVTPQMT
jgi:hypothetical protein